MEQPRKKLSPRDQILINAVRRLQAYDEKFGDPKVVAACSGELQQVFLRFAVRSARGLTHAEHSAVDEALRHIARIACGPVVFEDNYVEAGVFLAIAGETALGHPGQDESVDRGSEPEAEFEADMEGAMVEAQAQNGAPVGTLLKPGQGGGD